MTLGEKICELRKEQNLTQADLGDTLGVTYQAVSKWERNESLPDFEMISKIAKMFKVPISYFERDGEKSEEDNAEVEQSKDAFPIGVCTECGKYIYDDNVGEKTPKLICYDCKESRDETERRETALSKEREERSRLAFEEKYRTRTITAAIVAIILAIGVIVVGAVSGQTLGGIVFAVPIFTFVFQLFFDGMVRDIALSGFKTLKMPGLICTPDLDGLKFFIAMKAIFFVLSGILFVVSTIIVVLLAILISPFTFIPVVLKIAAKNDDLL